MQSKTVGQFKKYIYIINIVLRSTLNFEINFSYKLLNLTVLIPAAM